MFSLLSPECLQARERACVARLGVARGADEAIRQSMGAVKEAPDGEIEVAT
jgi:hypothetical protein